MRPVIGITASISDDRLSFSQKQMYCQAVADCGGLPLILPPQEDPALVTEILLLLDGLLLAGGDDIDPVLYGEEKLPTCGLITPIRDSWELPLCREAVQRQIPLLGICRGIQVLNVALGGTLYQDLPSQRSDSAIVHQQAEPPEITTHAIHIAKGSALAQTLGSTQLLANSHHHQAVKALAEDLTATAWAEDGVVEGVELCGSAFCLAVQWHPERLWNHPGLSAHQALFAALVEAARQHKKHHHPGLPT